MPAAVLYSCPCSDVLPLHHNPYWSPRPDSGDDLEENEEEGETFDPWAERSSFSLFPLDNLLFCEDCNQVRCPRCVQDEIVCYYCPSCLFEVPSSTVKSEGNRCTRNCFSCPICFASLAVTAIGEDQSGPYLLLCPHCLWSSSDIGIEFEKPTSITAQLTAKLKPLPTPLPTPESAFSTTLTAASSSYFSGSHPTSQKDSGEQTDEEAFSRLRAHYNHQKALSSSEDYGNTGSLSRLMGLYSTSGGRIRSYGHSLARTSAKGKSEWQEIDQVRLIGNDHDLLTKIKNAGFSGTNSREQRLAQPHLPHLLSELRPIAALLRTKRSKRCRACRHILVKPESKVNTIRYRMRLLATNYIPELSISRLDPAMTYNNLRPKFNHQFLLTVTNPLFDSISVHLATPPRAPGPFQASVTILCPELEVGPNSDVWDEALQSAALPKSKGKRTAAAGTIWDSGRNWTAVVLEIVPPTIPEEISDDEQRKLKVPVLVRSVYETDVERDGGLGGKDGKERREQAYWSVLEIGRVGKMSEVTLPPTRPMSISDVGDATKRKSQRLSTR